MTDGYTPHTLTEFLRVLQIFTVHYFEYAANYTYPGEAHDFWEFCYVDKGEVEVEADGKTIVLPKGRIIFHKPNEFHSLRANGTVAPNLVVASFSCVGPAMKWFERRILGIGAEERQLLARLVDEASDAFLSPLNDPELKQLERNVAAPPGAEQMIQHCLEALLIELYRKGHAEVPTPQKPTSLIKERGQQEMIDRVVHYLENNIEKHLALADICRDNLVGRSHLQKIFREKTGGGAMEYFGKLKIEAAKRLIREGHHNFTEIAAKLGYNSIHYFSRHFKKVTGMTPSEYASSVKVLTGRSRMQK